IDRCLARDRARRYADGAELRDAILAATTATPSVSVSIPSTVVASTSAIERAETISDARSAAAVQTQSTWTSARRSRGRGRFVAIALALAAAGAAGAWFLMR